MNRGIINTVFYVSIAMSLVVMHTVMFAQSQLADQPYGIDPLVCAGDSENHIDISSIINGPVVSQPTKIKRKIKC